VWFMVDVNGLQGCECVSGCRKWHWVVLYGGHLVGYLVEFRGRCDISLWCSYGGLLWCSKGFHDRVHRSDGMMSLEQLFRKFGFGVVMSVFYIMFFIPD
jgi:membrane-associated protease RseP (regulator of RpoE activity)